MKKKPSSIWNKGEKIELIDFKNNRKIRNYRCSSWRYKLTFEYSMDLTFDDKLEDFIDQFLAFKDGIINQKHDGVEYELSIYYARNDFHNGFVINQNIMKKLIELEMDLTIYPFEKIFQEK